MDKLSWGLHTFKFVQIIIIILMDKIAILSQFSSRYIRNYLPI